VRFRPRSRRFLDDGTAPGGLSCELVFAGHQHAIVRAAGELDVATVGGLRATIRDGRAAEIGRLTIDLRGISFIGADGIRLLLEETESATAAGVALAVVSSDRAHDVLRAAGVHSRLRHAQGWLVDRELGAGGDEVLGRLDRQLGLVRP
jgi:anti-anti-sigma factor